MQDPESSNKIPSGAQRLVQHAEFSVQSLTFRVQGNKSNVQSPASNTCVHNQEVRYAENKTKKTKKSMNMSISASEKGNFF